MLGNFYCFLVILVITQNVLGSNVTSEMNTTTDSPQPEYWIKRPEDSVAERGQVVRFLCSMNNLSGDVDIDWEHNGRNVLQNERYSIVNFCRGHRCASELSILDIVANDQGNVSCIFSDSVATYADSAKVTVIDSFLTSIDGFCLRNGNCKESNSYCEKTYRRSQNGTCKCVRWRPFYIEELQLCSHRLRLGSECVNDHHCSVFLNRTGCINGTCQCSEECLSWNDNCYRRLKLGDECGHSDGICVGRNVWCYQNTYCTCRPYMIQKEGRCIIDTGRGINDWRTWLSLIVAFVGIILVTGVLIYKRKQVARCICRRRSETV